MVLDTYPSSDMRKKNQVNLKKRYWTYEYLPINECFQVCAMLCSLENYYWRYTSASELVNMILAYVETRAHSLFQAPDFMTLSESMVRRVSTSRKLPIAFS